jgi:hypothetical protein
VDRGALLLLIKTNKMNIYRISQTENHSWDTYDAAIVSAPNEATARNMSPSFGGNLMIDWNELFYLSSWASKPENVTVKYLGVYHKEVCELILSSFNAG